MLQKSESLATAPLLAKSVPKGSAAAPAAKKIRRTPAPLLCAARRHIRAVCAPNFQDSALISRVLRTFPRQGREGTRDDGRC